MPGKKFRVFFEPQVCFGHCDFFFDFNGTDYELVTDINDPNIDIVVTDSENVNPAGKITVKLDLFHNYENQIPQIQWPNNFYLVTNAVNKKSYVSAQAKSLDFWFNIVKAYYSNREFKPSTHRWAYAGDRGYKMMPLPSGSEKKFVFLSANRTYQGRRIFRTRLVDFLKTKYNNKLLGFISNNDADIFSTLNSQCDFPDIADSSCELFDVFYSKPCHGFIPLHNSYFYHTFLSVYGETIEYGHSLAVTEKTYGPLIKGHFILPFSTNGLIAHLRSLGFEFPNFIDYSYDAELNVPKRFEMYLNELQRLLAMSRKNWADHWDQNLDLLRHNQDIFFTRPYEILDFAALIESAQG